MAPTTVLRRLPALAAALAGVLVAPLLAPAAAGAAEESQPFGGNVSYSWEIPDAPASGMTSLTMPMRIHTDSDHVDGSYVATQYSFTGQDDIGYMGLQPRKDEDGRARLHGVFSSFIAGTTSTSSTCTEGADGGEGVSCAVDFDAVYGRTYDLEVRRTAANTWSGSVIDSVTGKRHLIGEYTLPAGSGKLENSQAGFVENYWNYSGTCEGIQRIDATVGRPSTGRLTGRADAPKEYGACLDQANYSSSVHDGVVRISRGWL